MSHRYFAALSLWAAASMAVAEMPPARILDRYRQMLAANPAEGTALDRLWKAYAENGQTGALIEEYGKGTSFPDQMILGLLLNRAGRGAEAATAWTKAATLDPKSPLPHLSLAQLRSESGDATAAAKSYEEALRRMPENDARISATLEALGHTWMAAGKAEEAAAAWERTVALDPENIDLRRRLAEVYQENRLPERAIAQLEYVAAHAPASERAQAWQELSKLHQALRRPDEAIHALEQAVALTTPGSWLWTELESQGIRLHQRFGRTAELETRWKQQAAENPRDLGAELRLVEFYERTGDLEQQRAWLEKLTKLAPKNPAFRWRLARLLTGMGRREEAEKLYDSLIGEQPANADFILERAQLDIQDGQPKQARARLRGLLGQKGIEESTRARALEFYERNRMWSEVEEQLREDLRSHSEEAAFALARFLFSQHREKEAEAVLQEISGPGAPAAGRAGAMGRVAQLLRNQNLLQEAERTLTTALDLAEDDSKLTRELAMQLGEVQASLGHYASARTAYLRGVECGRNPAEIEEAEQRLFDVLRQLPERGDATAAARGAAEPADAPAPNSKLTETNPWVRQYIADLVKDAEANPSDSAWLRVARWHGWSHEFGAATSDLNRALALNPNSVAAEEAAVRLATSSGAPILARGHLERLIAIDPGKAIAYRRQLAQVDLQLGQVGDAIPALAKLVAGAPGDIDLLIDLAQAQQRAEHWDDAVKTWKAVYATAPGARKHEVVGPLRRLYEKLHLPQASAELLAADYDARTTPAEQLEAFKELLEFCRRESLLPWLRREWQARRSRKADDYATEFAWSQILKAEGDNAGAFAVLSDALYMVPNPADALPGLVRAAEELRRRDAAIDFQSRLVRLGAQEQPDALMKLADLQEMNFQVGPAEETWAQAIARFPRNTNVLLAAVDFFDRSGNVTRSVELLRRVRELEPTNYRALYALSQLDAREGNLAEAETCLEELLKVNPPRLGNGPIQFPALKREDAGRLQSIYLKSVRQRRGQPAAETMRALRGFWVDSSEVKRSDEDLRLNAIRDLAGLIRTKDDARSMNAWIARWKAAAETAPGDALWALFHAGASEPTMQVVKAQMERDPTNVQYKQGFIWMALQLRQFGQLAEWMHDRRRTTVERDFVRIALAQYLQGSGGRMEPELLAALAPPTNKARMWEMARLCAESGCFADAAALGRRAYASENVQRAGRGWEIAQWDLARGEPEQAREMLTQVAHLPAETLSSPVYDALLAACKLLPGESRPAFIEAFRRELATRPAGLPNLLTQVVLAGLAGEQAMAHEALAEVVAMRPLAPLSEAEIDDPRSRTTAAERSWAYFRDMGLHLQSWRMDTLAQDLWEQALANPALLHLQGDAAQEIAHDVQTRLLAVKVARASRDDWAELVAQAEHGARGAEATAELGEALEELGAVSRAVLVYQRQWVREPANAQVLRNLLNACRAADDTATAEAALQVPVAERLFALNDNVRRDFATQLADLLEARGAPEEARRMLADTFEGAPFDLRLMNRLATLSEQTGHLDEAESLWRRLLTADGHHAGAKLGLAGLYDKRGKPQEALAILRAGGTTGVEARVAQLLHASDQADEAISTVEHLGGSERVTATLALAESMKTKGDVGSARILLQDAVARGVDPLAGMQLQSQLIETFSPPADATLIERGLLKLRQIAGDDSGRLGLYFSFLQTHAERLGALEKSRRELTGAWAEGAGLLQAGMVLLGWKLDTAPAEAETVLGQILARNDLGEPWLQALLPSLTTAQRLDLAALVEERLLRINGSDFNRVIALVRRLESAGQHAHAVEVMKSWGARGIIDDSLAPLAAQTFIALGENGPAQEILRDIAAPKAALRAYQPFLMHADVCLGNSDFGPAKALLLRAFEHPAARDYSVLIKWLTTRGKLDLWAEELSEFHLSTAQLLGAKKAIFAAYVSSGELRKTITMLQTRPEVIDVEGMAAFRKLLARTGSHEQAAAVFQNACAQSKDAGLSAEYAAFLTEWADAELGAGQLDAAVKRLDAALTARPDLFIIAEKLYRVLDSHGRKDEAKTALARYLAAAPANHPDREKAAKLLRAER